MSQNSRVTRGSTVLEETPLSLFVESLGRAEQEMDPSLRGSPWQNAQPEGPEPDRDDQVEERREALPQDRAREIE